MLVHIDVLFLDVKCALALVAPHDTAGMDAIQTICAQYDRAFPRWSAHLTIMHPFVAMSSWDALLPALRARVVN